MSQNKNQSKSTYKMFSDAMRELIPYTHLGFELVAAVLVCFAIGYGFDVLVGIEPVFTIIFSILGIFVGLFLVLRTARMLNNRGKK